MRKSVLATSVVGLASAIGLMASPASALSGSSILPAIVLPSTNLQLGGGSCVPEFVAAGIGSTGGLPYKVQGVGYSSTPTSTPATQVECRFWDTDTNSLIAGWASGYKAGPAAELVVDYTVHTLDNFVTCVRVDTIDPNNGSVHSTPWTSSNGAYCGT
jgi:hypothetical protein